MENPENKCFLKSRKNKGSRAREKAHLSHGPFLTRWVQGFGVHLNPLGFVVQLARSWVQWPPGALAARSRGHLAAHNGHLVPLTRWVHWCAWCWWPWCIVVPVLRGGRKSWRGGGWGPKAGGLRLRCHHRTPENFFHFSKTQWVPLTSLHQQTPRDTLMSTMEQASAQSVGTVVTADPQLPSWLSCPDPKPPRLSKSAKELLTLEYEQIFERLIEGVYRGNFIRQLIEDDPRIVSFESFMKWVKRDPARYDRFLEAQEMSAIFEVDDALKIADGVGSIDPSSNDTVNRDKLRIDTRMKRASFHHKKRYGETKQIEFGGTISITEALAQAQARVIEAEVVDVTPRLEND